MVQLVSPLQAEDGRLDGQSTASKLWDVLVEEKNGVTLSELSGLAGLKEEDVQLVLDNNDLFVQAGNKYLLSVYVTVRWGVAGCGKIADDFCAALSFLPGAALTAAATSGNADRAADFAKRHGFARSYGSYTELADDKEVDIVYVANLHPQHRETAIMFMNAGKHVLCEKPIALNATQTADMIATAKKNGVFLAEGHWDRLFPANQAARALANSGRIGQVRHIEAHFGMNASKSIERLWQPSQGGGALLDIGVYALSFIQFVYGGEEPQKVQATAALQGGVDSHGTTLLTFGEGRTATALFSFELGACNTSTIFGSAGRITVPDSHAPSKVILVEVVGNGPGASEKQTDFEFQLPSVPDSVDHAGTREFSGFHYPTGEGFYFEAVAVHSAVLNGTLDLTGDLPLEQTQHLMDLCDNIRAEVGVRYPADDESKETGATSDDDPPAGSAQPADPQ
mmetsp:Transcript_3407/g.9853  ORF Transcript_3407/g.9853 Transcript_3407/m.9853 type:complete len:453 (+) Transcript_3407:122-1480(+)